MRARRHWLAGIVAVALLVAPTAVTAQEDGPAALSVELVEPPLEMSDEQSVFETTSSDSRATGMLTRTSATGLVDDDGQVFMVLHESARLENERGAWTGPILTHFYGPADGPPVGGSLWQLEGSGGYEGLSLLLSKIGTEDAWGIIVPSGTVPEPPALPAE